MIPKNPITMQGTLRRCWLFAFQTPIHEAGRHLPASLELITHGGFAFWNVVVCRIEAMRPKHLPGFLGMSYWHAAYRLYVRFHPQSGAPVEGLYFLRSDCDNGLMTVLGNQLTDFNFHQAEISADVQNAGVHLRINSPDAPAEARLTFDEPRLPSGSAFNSIEEAARFLKYKPYGISLAADGSANIVKIVRDENAWEHRLANVTSSDWRFFHDKKVQLEVCYDVNPIDYQWNRGYTLRGKS